MASRSARVYRKTREYGSYWVSQKTRVNEWEAGKHCLGLNLEEASWWGRKVMYMGCRHMFWDKKSKISRGRPRKKGKA
jgi:hypothetical protein